MKSSPPAYRFLLRVLLLFCWAVALAGIITGKASEAVGNAGVLAFCGFAVLTLPRLKSGSFLILGVLGVVGAVMLHRWPTYEEWLAAGRFLLIFTALVPTMALVKATAETMPTVRETQSRLAKLKAADAAAGLQLAGNAFGSVINTGSFALLSAAMPPGSNSNERQIAASAALRGMVTAAMWSPFFVAFAIGQSFVDPRNSWIAIGIGSISAICFHLGTIGFSSGGINPAMLSRALSCLKPITPQLVCIMALVLAFAFSLSLTALSAVVLVMPMLVLVQFVRHRQKIGIIIAETSVAMDRVADDLIIISMAMMIGYLVTRGDSLALLMTAASIEVVPGWIALILTPMVMTLASLVGIHPVVSSTLLLALFSGEGSTAHPALLMQSHLIGWACGTMASVASLSVITTAQLYRVSVRSLVTGGNMKIGLIYAAVSGIILGIINSLLPAGWF